MTRFVLDEDAVSGIFGAVSIVCWICVYSPQIFENFRRRSAEALSVRFIVAWLIGDTCNTLGGILQGVLPTMIVLAVYYVICDCILFAQCLVYKGFTLKDPQPQMSQQDDESRPLIASEAHKKKRREKSNMPRTFAINTLSMVLIYAIGITGWWIFSGRKDNYHKTEPSHKELTFNIPGQILGYICSAFYLTSRIPQMLLTYRRKSTEGILSFFFLCTCMGNLTYVVSILAWKAICESPHHCRPNEVEELYGKHILVNLSWLLGSFGVALQDMFMLGQFVWYRHRGGD